MRTTIDLPEDLLRRVKALAALRGVKMKDFLADLLEVGLRQQVNSGQSAPEAVGQRWPIPVVIETGSYAVPALTNAEIERILLGQDLEKIGLG